MRIGVDLLWLKVGKCGGLETFARHTLDGIACYDKKNEQNSKNEMHLFSHPPIRQLGNINHE